MKAEWRIGAVLGLAAVLVAGCGGPDIGGGRAKGKVTVGGQPVKDILVTFLPDAGGRPATGVTDATGSFTLSTLASDDGAVPGKHKVSFGVVTSGEPPPSDAPTPAAPALPFAAKYASAETSGITAEIVAGKVNELPIWDLEK